MTQTKESKYFLYIKFSELPAVRPVNATVLPGSVLRFVFYKVPTPEDKQRFIQVCRRLDKFHNIEILKEEYA